jgi:hypothetical protein
MSIRSFRIDTNGQKKIHPLAEDGSVLIRYFLRQPGDPPSLNSGGPMALRPRITTGLPVSEKSLKLMARQLLAADKVFVNEKLVNITVAGGSA